MKAGSLGDNINTENLLLLYSSSDLTVLFSQSSLMALF